MASVDYNALAADVLKGVGGEGNVGSVVHCATRLRFTLKDTKLADKVAVEKIPGVITVVESGGMFQVVVGNNVPKAYAALPKALTDDSAAAAAGGAKVGFVARVVDIVSAIFAPILGVMAGTGILKGLLAIALATKVLSTADTTYQILFAVADGLFMLLPMFLAVSAARKFGANIYTAMALAASLIYVSVQPVMTITNAAGAKSTVSLVAFANAGNPVTFVGLPVVLQSYTSTVLPIILAVYALSWVEKFFNKYIHEAVRNFVTPFLALLVMVPVTLMTIGPISNFLANGLANGLKSVYELSPLVFGFLMGGLWQVLVVFGIHWAIVPIFIQNLAQFKMDFIKSAAFASVLSQAGAAMGVALSLKTLRTRSLAWGTVIAGLFGITEPAIYGITLPRKRPFLIAVGAGAVGGAIIGGMKVAVYGTGAPGLLTLPIGVDPSGQNSSNIMWLVIGTVVAFVLAAVGTFFFGISPDEKAKDLLAAAEEKADIELEAAGGTVGLKSGTVSLKAPVEGDVIPLADVKDKVFASGAVGHGFGIVPTEGRFTAPVAGTIIVSMGHAYGIRTAEGVEVLVHIGLDTVKLQGTPFTGGRVKGDFVEVGDLLVEANLGLIRDAGFDTTTVVVVTNSQDFPETELVQVGPVASGTVVATTGRPAEAHVATASGTRG